MIEDVLEAFNKWLYIEDWMPIEITVATALAVYFEGDPIWLLVCGPPGSGKTEVVRTLSGDRVYSLDTLSQNSLVSGLADKNSKNQRFGIIQDIDGKVLVIKDLTVLLQSSKDMENNVFNQLRAAYDGEYAVAHGSGHKRQAYKSRFGFIAAVTEIIDSYRALSSSLGERFITIRVGVDSEKAIKRAQENTGKEFYMRTELKQSIADTIEYYSIVGKTTGLPVLPDDDLQKLRFLGEITAKLRTEVHKDYFRKSEVVPGLEVGTRLVKQLTRLGQLLMLIESYKYSKLARVARDCMSKKRLNTALAIYKNVKANPWELQKTAKDTYSNLKNDCEDLWRLGMCEKEDRGRSAYYSYKDDLMEKIILSEIFEE